MAHAPRLPTFRLIVPGGTGCGLVCHIVTLSLTAMLSTDHYAAREKNGDRGTKHAAGREDREKSSPSQVRHSPCPVPAAARCVAETAQSAAMCAKDVSLPTRAKTSLLHCGEVSVPD